MIDEKMKETTQTIEEIKALVKVLDFKAAVKTYINSQISKAIPESVKSKFKSKP